MKNNIATEVQNSPVPSIFIKLIFPSLYISIVLINQENATLVQIGQILGWYNFASSFIILYSLKWPKVLLFCVYLLAIIMKLLRYTIGVENAELFYLVAISLIYLFVGLSLISMYSAYLYKQVMILCAMNLGVMIFQVIGVGAWTQAFANYGEGAYTIPVKTLFVSASDLQYRLVQLRPSGISYSTVLLALLISYGIMLHFVLIENRIRWGTLILSIITVLAMGKLSVLAFILVALGSFFTANQRFKREVRRGIIYIVLFSILYMFVFPGLWQVNTSFYTISTSFYLRFNDILSVLSPESFLFGYMEDKLYGTASATWVDSGTNITGISSLVKIVQINRAFIIFGIVYYIYAVYTFRKRNSTPMYKYIISGLVVFTLPFSFPYWSIPLFWFAVAVPLLPLLKIFNSKLDRRMIY